jgi:hypothetical protein
MSPHPPCHFLNIEERVCSHAERWWLVRRLLESVAYDLLLLPPSVGKPCMSNPCWGGGLEVLFGLTIDDPWKRVALPCLAMQTTKWQRSSPIPLASNTNSEFSEERKNRCRMRV